MIKVGIVTTHRQANWGSVLQCFALQEALDTIGFQPETIDYMPEDVTLLGQLKRLKGKSNKLNNPIVFLGAIVAFSISYAKRKIVFSKYIKKNLHLTKKTYKKASEINEESVPEDIYCCGGDQTLNGFMMLDVFDNLKEQTVKVTYSSSFGKTQFSEDEWTRERNSLKRFNCISCREKSGIEIMQKMGIDNPKWIIDPVFLIPKERWIRLASKKYNNKKYILVYNLHHDKNIEAFEKLLSKEKNLPVINICNHWFEFYRYGKCNWAPSVEDFLSLLYNAEYVITDSFHATSFSIIFGKRFISVVPDLVGTRIVNILNVFELTNRMIAYGQKIDNTSVLFEELDLTKVNKTIQREVQNAICYIETWKHLV